jgi:sulfotransferase
MSAWYVLSSMGIYSVTPGSGEWTKTTPYFDKATINFENKEQLTISKKGFKGYLKGALHGFYDSITDRPYVVDKSRGWNSEIEFIKTYDSNPKIICMVRDPRAVYASLEKKYRKNPLLDHNIANWNTLTGTTTDKRIAYWTNNPPLGPVMDMIYQSLIEGTYNNILFVRFEDLTMDPNPQMARIYEYLELPYYQHDFNKIEQLTHEDDKVHGIFGDHIIRSVLKPVENDFKEVLGVASCKLIEEHYAWFFNDFGYTI